jgi:hypothetical protein
MMKNKGTYILLALVVAIWAVVGYRLVKYLKQDKIELPEEKAETFSLQTQNFIQDSFSITNNYRDPFLGSKVVVQRHISVSPKPAPKQVISKNIKWPAISFKGLVKNNSSQVTYALITIDGRLKNVQEKEEISAIKILNIQRDSIGVAFNNETKYFYKNKR